MLRQDLEFPDPVFVAAIYSADPGTLEVILRVVCSQLAGREAKFPFEDLAECTIAAKAVRVGHVGNGTIGVRRVKELCQDHARTVLLDVGSHSSKRPEHVVKTGAGEGHDPGQHIR